MSEQKINNDEVIEPLEDEEEIDCDDPNAKLTKWQKIVLKRLKEDLRTGVAWHPVVRDTDKATPKKPTAEDRFNEVLMEVSSWFVQTNGTFIKTSDNSMRYGFMELERLVPQMIAERYDNNKSVMGKVGKLTKIAMTGTSPDPRRSFGIYSGKAYPVPGNRSKRLWRDTLWDLNTWQEPDYRSLDAGKCALDEPCAFSEMLEFAIEEPTTRTILLDWISWCLQNEEQKPTWSILLYSEEKGTGKSTIGEVLEALFGAANSINVNGIQRITQRFAADVLIKKLIIAEEVHISSYSNEGNALMVDARASTRGA